MTELEGGECVIGKVEKGFELVTKGQKNLFYITRDNYSAIPHIASSPH